MSELRDLAKLKAIVDLVITACPDQVADYKDGKVKLMGFFVGQVMMETKGRANPMIANKLLKERLEDE